ncbi:hypothetical protein [Pseudomonas sp.]|uniref:hypothetical protein n=1 Tax=Pseudomonas sp. TaxID=306 RepID=UPI003241D59B
MRADELLTIAAGAFAHQRCCGGVFTKGHCLLGETKLIALTMRAVFGMGHWPTSQPAQYA